MTTEEATTAQTRSVLERYERDLYDARDLSLVSELLADPMYRHDAGGKVTTMSQAECQARIGGFFDSFKQLTFRTIHLVVEGSVASWTYELTLTAHDSTESVISSIETFEVKDGKITTVWNAQYTEGPWV